MVSEQFLTDTAFYADLVLPATTQLEQFDLMFSWGHLYLTLNEPAIAPRGEAVPNTELFRRLAHAMGFTDPHWERTDEQMVEEALDWSHPVLVGIDLASLRQSGWAWLRVGSPDDFVPHREGHFPTPSGKVEFKSSMAAGGNMVLPLFRQGYAGNQSGLRSRQWPRCLFHKYTASHRRGAACCAPPPRGLCTGAGLTKWTSR